MILQTLSSLGVYAELLFLLCVALILIVMLIGLSFFSVPLILPLMMAFIIKVWFGLSVTSLVFHMCTLGLFSSMADVVPHVLTAFKKFWYESTILPNRPMFILEPALNFVVSVYSAHNIRKILLLTGLVAYAVITFIATLSLRILSSRVFLVFCLFVIYIISFGITVAEVTVLFDYLNLLAPIIGFLNGIWTFSHFCYREYAQGRSFRRGALALLIIIIFNTCHASGLIVARHHVKAKKFTKAKVLRSMSMAFARFIDGVRLPQIVRSAGEAGFSIEEANEINNSLDRYLGWLRSIGYPVSADICEAEPMTGIMDGQFDANWLIAGSTWRIFAPQLSSFAQPEFRKFMAYVDEYRPSMTYQNLDNQLASISRYFYNPTNQFPEPHDVLDVVWDIVKVIYENSQITTAAWIYKKWNKKFNVGVYATSKKTNKLGGMRKLPRREWIARVGGPKMAISAFETMAKFALAFDTHAQFFTKVEWLKPSKWMNNVVRTPVAAMLPEYVVQMMLSADPNKRFEYMRTPIKLGMPIKHSTFERIWARHSRFQKHFAGDCTAFDSTIVGPVIRLVKAVRLKGYENHRDLKRIEKAIDRVYEVIEHGRLVSANSGNVYRKGSGLMTGHASTSPDNSLVMTSLYLVAWKSITGRSAEEFKAYNELSVYGDDHVLSISELAPASWNWNNIVLTMGSWGVTMREEVPSGGFGVPLDRVPFLKKFGRVPNTQDRLELSEAFGADFEMPLFVTYHDYDALRGKGFSAQTNRNPLYRAKRIQSYMYLCGHNKETFDDFHNALEMIFKKYPGIRTQIGQYTPSYSRVLLTWYTGNVPIEVIDEEDESILVDGSEAIVLYGEVTIVEKIMNILSLVPDVVNPALRNIGPIEYMMRVFGPLLSWPKALIAQTNSISSKGHLEALVANTSYDFLSKTVPFYSPSNYSTLVLRHWIYMLLQQSKSYSFAFYLTGFFSQLIRSNFLLNGFVAQSRPKFAISYWNLSLIVVLNFLNIPDFPSFNVLLKTLKLPDLVGFFDDLYQSLATYLLHKIPASFQDIIGAFGDHDKMIISAPTGSGKSTSMVYMLSRISNAPKIYVIEPRKALVHSLATYLNGQFVWEVGCKSGDVTENFDARVVFITHGIFLQMHGQFMGRGALFIVDEFHVNENLMTMTNEILLNSTEKVIFASATPLHFDGVFKIPLVVASSYSYHTFRDVIPVNDVLSAFTFKCQEISRGYNPWFKHLVFVDTFQELDHLVNHLGGKVGTISGRGVFLSPEDTWIVATSTADVGVTIPNVDVVITRDFHFSHGQFGKGFYPLPESIIIQRSGRTGRTNNGFVHVVSPSEPNRLFAAPVEAPLQSLLIDRLRFGLNIPKEWYVPLQLTGIADKELWFNFSHAMISAYASSLPENYDWEYYITFPYFCQHLLSVFQEKLEGEFDVSDDIDIEVPSDADSDWEPPEPEGPVPLSDGDAEIIRAQMCAYVDVICTSLRTLRRLPEEDRSPLAPAEEYYTIGGGLLTDPNWQSIFGSGADYWYEEYMGVPYWSRLAVVDRIPKIFLSTYKKKSKAKGRL
jgi:hypothetical protein